MSGDIGAGEINDARTKIITLVQLKYFESELKYLKQYKCVLSNSKLFLLNTFLDENEIIRVDGRLNKSETIHGIKKTR